MVLSDACRGPSVPQGLSEECAGCWWLEDRTGTGWVGGVSAHTQCSQEEGMVSCLSPRGWMRQGPRRNNSGQWGWWVVAPMCPGGFAEDQVLPGAGEAGVNSPQEAMPIP